MARAVQALDPFDPDHVASRALDFRAHRFEALGEVDDLRFARGVLDDRRSVGERRGHHEIFGSGHGHEIGADSCAFQLARARDHVALLDADRRAHRLQTLDVLIDRTQADRTPAGQRHARFTAARKQRPQCQHRRAHRLDELVGGDRTRDIRRRKLDAELLVHRYRDAHLSEQIEHGRDVAQVRHVFHEQRLPRQKRRAEYRQRGVLRARDGDFAFERGTAFDYELVHYAP